MNEELFWELIEASWADAPEDNEDRLKALETNDEDELLELSDTMTDVIVHNYRERLAALDQASLTAFLRILEEKLFHLDRKEIHNNTDGSDDGFLYARGFIVFMGEAYYNKIDQNPSEATEDVECDEFVFAGYDVYEDKFAEEFQRNLIHNTESTSNKDGGWDEAEA
ncbi:Protein of unknown function [Chitinophaga costaii]|uniref:DUF4240 domain-containing protein n=1 Tax=Chitinophaga costaii TaxID=1335309 RepID=A0A1C4BV27_9BACT|nr:DUF4240 domain-containing protein [Chitinophaga costaii]PUZ27459.1 DUF4240 domain-containing protein [Chitinophaga costaii]SCC10680.1 Protein of unknown function [Chitinophaga costaii]